ncbi:MAG: hypothetical protein HC904_15460 [Blastochloris sp.]|nr:hypothetical protein [Blastochloris sp.]
MDQLIARTDLDITAATAARNAVNATLTGLLGQVTAANAVVSSTENAQATAFNNRADAFTDYVNKVVAYANLRGQELTYPLSGWNFSYESSKGTATTFIPASALSTGVNYGGTLYYDPKSLVDAVVADASAIPDVTAGSFSAASSSAGSPSAELVITNANNAKNLLESRESTLNTARTNYYNAISDRDVKQTNYDAAVLERDLWDGILQRAQQVKAKAQAERGEVVSAQAQALEARNLANNALTELTDLRASLQAALTDAQAAYNQAVVVAGNADTLSLRLDAVVNHLNSQVAPKIDEARVAALAARDAAQLALDVVVATGLSSEEAYQSALAAALQSDATQSKVTDAVASVDTLADLVGLFNTAFSTLQLSVSSANVADTTLVKTAVTARSSAVALATQARDTYEVLENVWTQTGDALASVRVAEDVVRSVQEAVLDSAAQALAVWQGLNDSLNATVAGSLQARLVAANAALVQANSALSIATSSYEVALDDLFDLDGSSNNKRATVSEEAAAAAALSNNLLDDFFMADQRAMLALKGVAGYDLNSSLSARATAGQAFSDTGYPGSIRAARQLQQYATSTAPATLDLVINGSTISERPNLALAYQNYVAAVVNQKNATNLVANLTAQTTAATARRNIADKAVTGGSALDRTGVSRNLNGTTGYQTESAAALAESVNAASDALAAQSSANSLLNTHGLPLLAGADSASDSLQTHEALASSYHTTLLANFESGTWTNLNQRILELEEALEHSDLSNVALVNSLATITNNLLTALGNTGAGGIAQAQALATASLNLENTVRSVRDTLQTVLNRMGDTTTSGTVLFVANQAAVDANDAYVRAQTMLAEMDQIITKSDADLAVATAAYNALNAQVTAYQNALTAAQGETATARSAYNAAITAHDTAYSALVTALRNYINARSAELSYPINGWNITTQGIKSSSVDFVAALSLDAGLNGTFDPVQYGDYLVANSFGTISSYTYAETTSNSGLTSSASALNAAIAARNALNTTDSNLSSSRNSYLTKLATEEKARVAQETLQAELSLWQDIMVRSAEAKSKAQQDRPVLEQAQTEALNLRDQTATALTELNALKTQIQSALVDANSALSRAQNATSLAGAIRVQMETMRDGINSTVLPLLSAAQSSATDANVAALKTALNTLPAALDNVTTAINNYQNAVLSINAATLTLVTETLKTRDRLDALADQTDRANRSLEAAQLQSVLVVAALDAAQEVLTASHSLSVQNYLQALAQNAATEVTSDWTARRDAAITQRSAATGQVTINDPVAASTFTNYQSALDLLFDVNGSNQIIRGTLTEEVAVRTAESLSAYDDYAIADQRYRLALKGVVGYNVTTTNTARASAQQFYLSATLPTATSRSTEFADFSDVNNAKTVTYQTSGLGGTTANPTAQWQSYLSVLLETDLSKARIQDISGLDAMDLQVNRYNAILAIANAASTGGTVTDALGNSRVLGGASRLVTDAVESDTAADNAELEAVASRNAMNNLLSLGTLSFKTEILAANASAQTNYEQALKSAGAGSVSGFAAVEFAAMNDLLGRSQGTLNELLDLSNTTQDASNQAVTLLNEAWQNALTNRDTTFQNLLDADTAATPQKAIAQAAQDAADQARQNAEALLLFDGDGNILKVDADSLITAQELTLSAAGLADVRTRIQSLSATGTNGAQVNLTVLETGVGVSLLIDEVETFGGDVTITANTASSIIIHLLNAGSGNITLSTSSGFLDMFAAGSRISGGLLTAVNVGGLIDLSTNVVSASLKTVGTNTITLTEQDAITLIDVESAAGAIVIHSGGDTELQRVVSASGPVTVTVTAGDLLARLVTALTIQLRTLISGDMSVGALAASSILLNSAGRIFDLGGKLVAQSLNSTSVGSATLDTTVSTLLASITGVGDLTITEAGNIDITQVTVANGKIDVTAGGNILATQFSPVIKSDANDLRLVSLTGNITVGSIDAGNSGDVELSAELGSIFRTAGKIIADELIVRTLGDATLDTTVNRLAVFKTGRGDIIVTETDAFDITGVEIQTGLSRSWRAVASRRRILFPTRTAMPTMSASRHLRATSTSGIWILVAWEI